MKNREFKVDFFCVGVAKAGTTTLHDLLGIQPGISLPKRKETNYFSFGMEGRPNFAGPLDNTSVNDPTITTLDEYIEDFDRIDDCLIGEVCPSYVLAGTAEKIRAHNPDAKIILLLREPVSRAFSNYQHLVRDGREHDSFESALEAEDERIASGWEWFWGLKRNSLYFDATDAYIRAFGEENVLIILFEDFIQDQNRYLQMVMEFIGLDPDTAVFQTFDSNKSGVVSSRWKHLHKALLSEGTLNSALRRLLPEPLRKRLGQALKQLTTVKTNVAPATRERMTSEFAHDMDKLESLIGRRISRWREGTDVS